MIRFADLAVKRDRNQHVALIFAESDTTARFIAFTESGPKIFEEPVEEVWARFHGNYNQPLDRTALAFLRTVRSAYIPGDNVAQTLLEIYIMAKAGKQVENMNELPLATLVDVYNELAAQLKRSPVTSFKDKATAIARIDKLNTELAQLTPKQEANKADAERKVTAKATVKAAIKEEAEKAKPKKAPSAPVTTKQQRESERKKVVAARKADKPTAAASTGKLTIGRLCEDLILKGKSNEEILTAVQKQFPGAQTKDASVSWYRNKLKNEGKV